MNTRQSQLSDRATERTVTYDVKDEIQLLKDRLELCELKNRDLERRMMKSALPSDDQIRDLEDRLIRMVSQQPNVPVSVAKPDWHHYLRDQIQLVEMRLSTKFEQQSSSDLKLLELKLQKQLKQAIDKVASLKRASIDNRSNKSERSKTPIKRKVAEVAKSPAPSRTFRQSMPINISRSNSNVKVQTVRRDASMHSSKVSMKKKIKKPFLPLRTQDQRQPTPSRSRDLRQRSHSKSNKSLRSREQRQSPRSNKPSRVRYTYADQDYDLRGNLECSQVQNSQLLYSLQTDLRQSNAQHQMSPKHSETTYQSLLDRSMQLKVTDERLAKLEKMYQELSNLEQIATQR